MMNKSLLYISDSGLLILLVIYLPLCLLALWFVGRVLREFGCPITASRWVRGFLALAMLLWPTWDAIPGKYYLDRYCEQGGVYAEPGIRIDGIYFPGKGNSGNERLAEAFLRMGFKYIEAGSDDGSIIRYERGNDGKLQRKTVSALQSQYISKVGNSNRQVQPEFLDITMVHYYLMHIETKKDVAGYKNYRFQSRFDGKYTLLDIFPSISCKDLKKYKKQERFSDPSDYYSLVISQEG